MSSPVIALLASVAILAGVGSTHNLGEQSPAWLIAFDARHRDVAVEATLDGAHKVETGDGWASRLSGDWWSGPLSIGAGWAHRETSLWRKDRLFVRASAQHGPLRLIAEVAPTSSNMEAKAEARLRLRAPAWGGYVLFEPRAFVMWHSTAEELGGYAWGLQVLVGYAN